MQEGTEDAQQAGPRLQQEQQVEARGPWAWLLPMLQDLGLPVLDAAFARYVSWELMMLAALVAVVQGICLRR